MKKALLILTIILFSFVGESYSQIFKLPSYYRKFMNVDSLVKNTPEALFLYPEVIIYPQSEKKTRRQKRRYEKLVRNFIKVYPYALTIARTYRNIDDSLAVIESDDYRDKYLKVREKQIMDYYKPKLKKLTISQSVLLVKLLDRETGSTAYEIVHEIKGSVDAVFWQTFALMFGNSLKKSYDSDGDDKEIEYLVRRFNDGTI